MGNNALIEDRDNALSRSNNRLQWTLCEMAFSLIKSMFSGLSILIPRITYIERDIAATSYTHDANRSSKAHPGDGGHLPVSIPPR
jgi:hypothetical protein